MSYEQAAGLFITYPTSYEGLVGRGEVKKGDWVLVHAGAGGVGLAAVQIAKGTFGRGLGGLIGRGGIVSSSLPVSIFITIALALASYDNLPPISNSISIHSTRL